VVDPRSRDGLSTFRLVVTFKADAFKVVAEPVVPPPVEAAVKPEVQS
jgi:hypothetical protein